MCGIAGYLGYNNLSKTVLGDIAKTMAAALSHRGPDDEGVWSDEADEVTLVHRRLSIIDLSKNGHQPMLSASKRHILVFNGEIYNHLELRAKLDLEGAAPKWKGYTDTETLLACIEKWGLKRTLRMTTGMFALALWDRREQEVSLARDRMGEKPLYYGEQNGVFIFASELKPITRHPSFEAKIDPNAISKLMQYYYIPAPMSIYRGIKKLEPGRILKVKRKRGNFSYDETSYWSLSEVVNAGHENQLVLSEGEIIEGLEELLLQAVGGQIIADVPVGAFLSGGVDSSLIVALMQAVSSRPVNTYSIGFDAGGDFVDEAPYAKAVAQHIGTHHTEMYVTAQDALNIIPEIPQIYDEPFADSSQVPTILLSRLSREHVTVALTGDGGDELFGGYDRYPYTIKAHRMLKWIPHSLRRTLSTTNRMIPWSTLESLSSHSINKFIGKGGNRGLAYKMEKLNRALHARSTSEFYDAFIVQWLNTSDTVLNSDADGMRGMHLPDLNPDLPFSSQMLAIDMHRYLPDDLLTKVDRAAMAASLETRIPLLDHAVVEYAQKVPIEMKIRGNEKKHILNELLYRHVPKELVDRPKRGFGAPIEAWLKGGLRDWAEDLLSPEKIRTQGYFKEQVIRKKWEESLSGKRDWLAHLWPVLMFQAWEKGR